MKIQKIVEQNKNDILEVEYIPNHSGCLLTSRAVLIVKNNNHQTGSVRKNFNVLEAVVSLFIFWVWLEIYRHF